MYLDVEHPLQPILGDGFKVPGHSSEEFERVWRSLGDSIHSTRTCANLIIQRPSYRGVVGDMWAKGWTGMSSGVLLDHYWQQKVRSVVQRL
eukprot:191106-Amorphochlora_amoeboformis.AAC.1